MRESAYPFSRTANEDRLQAAVAHVEAQGVGTRARKVFLRVDAEVRGGFQIFCTSQLTITSDV